MTLLRTSLSFGLLVCLSAPLAAQYFEQGPPWNPSSSPFGIAQGFRLPSSERVPAFLGVELEEAEGWGVVVKRVVAGGAADSVGVEVSDRVIGLAGAVTESVLELQLTVAKHAAGDEAQLVLRRGRALLVKAVVFGKRPPVRPVRGRLNGAHERAVAFLNVRPGMVIADIGCGYGWLTMEVAELAGATGKVFGLEIHLERMEALKQHEIANVTWVHSKPDDLTLDEDVLDLAVLHDVASHVNEWARVDFYASIARSLKPSGKLVVFGPHAKARKMLDELQLHGFSADNAGELGNLSTYDLDQRLKAGIRFSYKAK